VPAYRIPNTRLRLLLARSGWTGQKLAEAVNALGAENGVALHYDRTSIAHWLSGTRPSAVVVRLVAEVLTRRFGRPVDPEETGLIDPVAPVPVGPDTIEAVVGQLVFVGDKVRRREVREVIYVLALSAVPVAADVADTGPPVADNGEQVGTAHADTADVMLSVFSDNDAAFGGGSALTALSAYLGTDVASWLRAPAAPVARVRLRSSASRLTYLAGWMSFDEVMHGAGQRYYRAAARLAGEAGDIGCYAAALRGLSVQAHYLGHHASALELAEAAVAESTRVPRSEAAFLAGQLGVAYAARGDRRAAFAQIRSAERLLDRADGADLAVGGYHAAALTHQQAETLAAVGDREAAIRALTGSLRHRPHAERRAHAITTARLAELYLDIGQLDEACAAWTTLLDESPHLRSGRVEEAIRTMSARLRPHGGYSPARTLLAQASQMRLATP
jgi:tetratricopeptide (TPR) repeat protein/transcriptional regulator with XRE-family HTH domain